jgi:hypothetical protein
MATGSSCGKTQRNGSCECRYAYSKVERDSPSIPKEVRAYESKRIAPHLDLSLRIKSPSLSGRSAAAKSPLRENLRAASSAGQRARAFLGWQFATSIDAMRFTVCEIGTLIVQRFLRSSTTFHFSNQQRSLRQNIKTVLDIVGPTKARQ